MIGSEEHKPIHPVLIIFASIFLLIKLIKPYEYPFQGTLIKKIMDITKSLIQGSIELNSHKMATVKIFTCSLLSYCIRLGMLYWGFLAVQVNLHISQLIFINLIFSLQGIINFLPGNIGVQEVLIAFSAVIIGENFSAGLIVAGIIRIVSLLEIFLLGLVSYKLLNINSFLQKP